MEDLEGKFGSNCDEKVDEDIVEKFDEDVTLIDVIDRQNSFKK